MRKGHRPGEKTTRRSLKVLPGRACEIRDHLLAAYRASEPGTQKHINTFTALQAHEKKHDCGPKLANYQRSRRV